MVPPDRKRACSAWPSTLSVIDPARRQVEHQRFAEADTFKTERVVGYAAVGRMAANGDQSVVLLNLYR